MENPLRFAFHGARPFGPAPFFAAAANLTIGSVRRLEGESVAETGYGSEVGRTAGIILQLLPKFHDVIIDAASGGVPVFMAANLVQQLCGCDDAVRILNEKLESPELTGGQSYGRTVSCHLHFLEVHRNAIKNHLTGGEVAVKQPSAEPATPAD